MADDPSDARKVIHKNSRESENVLIEIAMVYDQV